MKKAIYVASILALFIYCGQELDKVEKHIEDGTEVIDNHLEPYKIDGEPHTFILEEEFVIDPESKDLLDKGMRLPGEFDVDSEGNIYIIDFRSIENYIYKFNKYGDFIDSFCKRGQGPGELEWPMHPVVMDSDEIYITDWRKKLLILSTNGSLIKEIRFKTPINTIEPLKNGKYLILKQIPELKTYESYYHGLYLCNSKFEVIKKLDVKRSLLRGSSISPFFCWRVSNDNIYIANEIRGYEIWIYDLEGKLIRKIKKEYRPVRPSKKLIRLILGSGYEELTKMNKNYFPKYMHSISFFFSDDKGRLFVMTYEDGENNGEYIYDIFNPKGIYIGRKSLDMYWVGLFTGIKYAMAKRNYLYCYREKESGFRELLSKT